MLAAVTLLGAWLRALHLGQPSLWWDEFITVGSSLRPLPDMLSVLKYLGPSDIGVELFPPLAHVITHWLVEISRSDVLVRLPGVLAGAALIPATWLLCRNSMGRLGAHAACLLLAVSAYHIHYSREVRPYSLFLLENALALHFLHAALAEGRRRLLWAWGAVVAAMLYTSYMAATLVAAQSLFAAVYLGLAWRRGEKARAWALGWRAAAALALAGAAYLPWAQGQILVFKLLHDPGFKARFTFDFIDSMLREFAAFPYRGEFPAGWLLAAMGLAGFAACAATSGKFAALMALWAFMPVAGIFLAKARMELTSRYLVTVFYFLIIFSGHFLGLAVGRLADRLALGSRPIPAMRLLGVAALALMVSAPNLQSLDEYYSRETSRYKQFIGWLTWNAQDADLILFYNPRNLKLIHDWYGQGGHDWYGQGGPRPARLLEGGGYHRAVLLAPESARAASNLPLAVARGRFDDVDVLGLGIARTPAVPMIPGASGLFEYRDDFSGYQALQDAKSLTNLTPSPLAKTLARHDAGLPARAVYEFRVPGGLSLGEVSLSAEISTFLSGVDTDDAMTFTLLVPGRPPERLAVLDMAAFRLPDGSLRQANHERKRTASLEIDLTGRLAGARSFELAMESGKATRSGAIELENFRVAARMDGPAPPRQALPLALLEQIPLEPYVPGVRQVLSGALHAFSLDGAVSLPGRPDISGPLVGGPDLLAAYLAEHPGDKPVRVLPYPDGSPAVLLHDPALAFPWLRLEPGRGRPVASPGETVRSIRLSGALDAPTLRLGALRLPILVECPAPAELSVNPGGSGELVFSPLFTAGAFDPSAMEAAGEPARAKDEDCLACPDNRECSVTYTVRSALPLTRLHITAFPRVFADSRSSVRTLVSLDRGPWREVNAYRGSGSERWEGLKIPQYSMVRPDSPAREARVRFVLSGKAQLWSAPDARMRLGFALDASSLPAPVLTPGTTTLAVESGAPLGAMLLGKPQHFPERLMRTR